MIYHLSSRQRKELDRGVMLHICLPDPDPLAPRDLVAWARSMLDVDPQWVRVAARLSLPVQMDMLVASDGLTGILGHIEPPMGLENVVVWLAVVEVKVYAQDPRRDPRGHGKRQWPATVTLAGKVYPPAE